MRRREFLAALLAAPIVWPAQPAAQESGRTYRLGFLTPQGRQSAAIVGFFDELRLNGFVEGQNLTVAFDGFGVSTERINGSVSALVATNPDAIVGGAELYARALQAATKTIPILIMSEDIVGEGLAASLARPSGNLSGISLLSRELDGKRQGLLIEAVADGRRLAALVDSTITPQHHRQTLQAAAQSRGIELSFHSVTKSDQIATALDEARAKGAEAINILASPLLFFNRRQIIERTTELDLPSIYQFPDMAEEGGLIGYGPRLTQLYRMRARQVVKVLRGAKPSEIPVEQPTSFELVINLKTAKAIRHEVPASMVLRSDKLVE
jgi:putative ABC transport system substrate-binding protein